jgi:hypothetical protein
VGVVIDEARNGEAPAQIDQLRIGGRVDVECRDAVAVDEDAARERVARPDPAVRERELRQSSPFICAAR